MTREQIAAFIAGLNVGDIIEVIWEKSGNRSVEHGPVWQPSGTPYLGLGPDLLNPSDTELVDIGIFSRAPIEVAQPPLGSVAVFVSTGVPNLPDGIFAFKRLKRGWYGAGGAGPLPWAIVTRGRVPTQVFQPGARPAAPTITSLTAGDRKIDVVATLGDQGGSPIRDVQYLLVFEFEDGLGQETRGWISTGQTTGTFSILNLTNGIAFTVRVRAVNGSGPGPQSGPQTATPAVPSP